MNIKIINKGSFENTKKFCKNAANNQQKLIQALHKYGERGVSQLQKFTPIRTGKTAFSWFYRVDIDDGKATLTFCNDNVTKMGITVAILIEYGHATKNGYWVQGIEYIDPALAPVFDKLAKDTWEEVTR